MNPSESPDPGSHLNGVASQIYLCWYAVHTADFFPHLRFGFNTIFYHTYLAIYSGSSSTYEPERLVTLGAYNTETPQFTHLRFSQAQLNLFNSFAHLMNSPNYGPIRLERGDYSYQNFDWRLTNDKQLYRGKSLPGCRFIGHDEEGQIARRTDDAALSFFDRQNYSDLEYKPFPSLWNDTWQNISAANSNTFTASILAAGGLATSKVMRAPGFELVLPIKLLGAIAPG